MPNTTLDIQNKRWYKDKDINRLMRYYFASHSNVDVLAALLGTDWLGEKGTTNTLKDTLNSLQEVRSDLIAQGQPVKDKILVPINLDKNHWALLYFVFNGQAVQPENIYYFDPFGTPINANVEHALQSVFKQSSIVNINARVQEDGYNCGPWVVEAARSLVDAGAEPSCNISKARLEHEKIIKIAKVKESDDALKTAYSALLSRPESKEFINSLNSLQREFLSKKYLENEITEDTDEDYLLARSLQNEEIKSFLKENKEIKSFLKNTSSRYQPMPYIPGKAMDCHREAAEGNGTNTENQYQRIGIV